jgi:hypothetical protein
VLCEKDYSEEGPMSKDFEKIKRNSQTMKDLIIKIQIITYRPIFCWAG